MTPASVHYGEAVAVQSQRQSILSAAFEGCPERFRRGMPIVKGAPTAVYINPPQRTENLS